MQKNGFLTLCFSFIPGAGQMYQGYMKRGVTQVLLFVIPLMIGGVFWGMDHLVPAPLSLPVFTVLAVLFAVAVGAGMVAAGLHLYNRAAEARREEANR